MIGYLTGMISSSEVRNHDQSNHALPSAFLGCYQPDVDDHLVHPKNKTSSHPSRVQTDHQKNHQSQFLLRVYLLVSGVLILMKNIGNLLLAGFILLMVFDSRIYTDVMAMVIRIIHFLLLFYLLWILLFDYLKSLKKKLGEKFGLQLKVIKRKLFKIKH
jgi:hypothetical protein